MHHGLPGVGAVGNRFRGLRVALRRGGAFVAQRKRQRTQLHGTETRIGTCARAGTSTSMVTTANC